MEGMIICNVDAINDEDERQYILETFRGRVLEKGSGIYEPNMLSFKPGKKIDTIMMKYNSAMYFEEIADMIEEHADFVAAAFEDYIDHNKPTIESEFSVTIFTLDMTKTLTFQIEYTPDPFSGIDDLP